MSVGPSAAMLRQFEAAQRIREMFFRPGGQEPEVRFRVTPTDLDVGATRFLLEIDGQSFENRHGPERSCAGGVARAEPRSGGRDVRLARRRPAEHRRSGAVGVVPPDGRGHGRNARRDVRYVLTFAKDGHEARVTVRGRKHPQPVRQGRPAAVPLRS